MPLISSKAVVVAALLGGSWAAAQTVSQAELRAADLTTYWEVALPLSAGQTVADCYLVDDQIYAGTNDGYVYAVHAHTGAIRWLREVTRAGYRVWRPAHAKDRTLFVVPSGVRQYDRAFGDPIHETRLRFAAGAAAVSDGSNYFLGGTNGRFYCLNIDWDYEIWKNATGAQIIGTPALFNLDGRNYVAVPSDDHGVYACRASDKARAWVMFTDGPNSADLYADANGVFVPSRDRSLYLLEPRTGATRWRARLSSPLTEPPVVIGERAYQYSEADGVVCININGQTDDERMGWKLENGRRMLTADKSHVYAMTRDETVVQIDPKNGKVKNTLAVPGFTHAMPHTTDTGIFLGSADGRILCLRTSGQPLISKEQFQQAMRGKGEPAGSQPAETAEAAPRRRPVVSEAAKPLGPPIGGKSKVSKKFGGGGGEGGGN